MPQINEISWIYSSVLINILIVLIMISVNFQFIYSNKLKLVKKMNYLNMLK